MTKYLRTESPSPGRCTRCGARCHVARHLCQTEDGTLIYLGDRCAEIVLDGATPWKGKGSKGSKGESAPEDEEIVKSEIPVNVRPKTFPAKFPGACSCGRPVVKDQAIVFDAGSVSGCEGCDWGRADPLPVSDDFKVRMDEVYKLSCRYDLPKGQRAAVQAQTKRMLARWCRLPAARAQELSSQS